MACINPNTPEFKAALERTGNPLLAEIEVSKSLEVKPIGENDNLQYQFKLVDKIYNNLEKVNKLWKQIGNNNTFWNKVQQDLQIPKEQIELLKESEGDTIEEKLTSFAANYSYTVKINIAKEKSEKNDIIDKEFEVIFGYKKGSFEEFIRKRFKGEDEEFIKTQIDKDFKSLYYDEYQEKQELENDINTSYYSNLTVPGGTNYTENDIATPAIKPSDTGHNQFHTDNSIGWFRSDDKISENVQGEIDYEIYDAYSGIAGEEIPGTRTTKIVPKDKFIYNENTYEKKEPLFDEEDYGTISYTKNGKSISSNEFYQAFNAVNKPTKTRRVLEVQSDLFQKGRDKKLLAGYNIGTIIETDKGKFKILDIFNRAILDNQGQDIGTEEVAELENLITGAKGKVKTSDIILKTGNKSENQFLQLLNKGGNWVTFFVKSIIQDSAKKGYEKVLFPSGNTASKVEGHTTLEEFKKEKEDRIKELEIADNRYEKWLQEIDENGNLTGRKAANKEIALKRNFKNTTDLLIDRNEKEINQLKEELKRVDEEGFAALKPIYNFYENTVKNVLNKQYGKENVKEVTDEYGNTWNEVTLTEKNKEEIYFQKEAQSKEKPSENIDNKIKKFLASIGVNVKLVENLTDINGNKLSGIAVADMLNKIIQIVDGKADVTTLPEEAAHFFVEMLGENNPLFKQMFDKITSYKIYSETVDQYRNNKAYKNADGSLNITKLKKEAIAKLIMTHIVRNETNNENADKIKTAQSWWSKLLEWLTNIFKQNPTNPFETAAEKILAADTSDLNLELTEDELFFQQDISTPINKIIADQSAITLDDSIDPKTGERKHVYQENLRPIVDKNGDPRSVTNNVVTPWYKQRFPLDTRAEMKKTIDEFAAERGTEVHSDLQNIVERYFNKDGTPRETVLPRSEMKTNVEVYNKLEEYIVSLIKEFESKPGTKFLAEVKIYSRKRNLPGTIDLLIVEPDGTTHIYDWKSQQVDKDQTELKWFKPEAYRIQLGEYKKILMEEYGIFKFGKIRAVPIRTKFKIANVNGVFRPIALEDIEMEYDINNIPKDKDYLLPVVMLDESTGDNKLDSLLAKLNAVYEKVSQKKVLESEKPFKAEELNLLKKTIRDLHIRKDMSTFIENGLFEINKYRDKINNGTFNLSDSSESMLVLNVYSEGSVFLEELLKDLKKQIREATDPDVIQYLKNLQDNHAKMSLNAKALLVDIVGIKGEKNPSGIISKIGNEFAQEEGITTLLNPEVKMKFQTRNFRSLSTLPTAAAQLFSKVLRRAQGIRNIKIKELNEELQTIKKNLEEWGNAKGLKGNDIFNPILNIDEKGNWTGDFVKIYSEEYFKLKNEALKNEDVNWLKNNTTFDEEKYNLDLQKLKDNLEERYPGEDDYVVKRKQSILDEWVLKHSSSSRFAYLNTKNFYVKPKEKWYSDKYKTIYKKDSSGKYVNQPLVDTYEYFQKLIKLSAELGMIDRFSSRFIPGVVSNNISSVLGTSFKNMYDIQGAFDSLAIDAEGGFGKIDPLTGVLKKQLPVYFTKDLGVQKSDGTIDYSNKSKDLFSVFSIWGQQMYNHEAMDSIREKADALVIIEENKGRLETNIIGNITKDKNIIAENAVNAEVLKDMVNYYVYGQTKGEDVDKVIKVLGKTYSLKKGVKKLITLSTFKALALNPLAGTATFVGGTGNAWFIASKRKLFTEGDWANGLKDFSSNDEVTSAGLDFFDLGLDEKQKQDVRNLSTDWKKRNLKWDHLMFMQHYGDRWATYPVASTMLRTHMFDGKDIVSIRDYVKQQNNYDKIYDIKIESERKAILKKIDKEIEELQKTKSLKAVGKVENGKFVIPGLDRKSDAAINFKAAVQKTLKSMIGNASRDDMNLIRMGLQGQVLMQFRSWMPQLMMERFGDMTKDVDLDTWEYGKARLFLKHIFDGRVLPLTKELILGFGNNTIDKAKDRYQEFVLRLLETGKISSKEEFMSEAEFIDMYIGNLRSAYRELLLLISFSLLLFLGLGLGDDDDDEDVSGFRKYVQKALEKYKNEFSFYYSPTEFTKMLKNPVPMVGFFEDFEKFVTQGIGQVYNFGVGDEEGMKSNKPAKYFFKILPVTKEGLNFYALYDEEFRKEWAIK
jgi:hypothetical protein